MKRRTFVTATGATFATIGVAGCTGQDDGAGAQPTETETEVGGGTETTAAEETTAEEETTMGEETTAPDDGDILDGVEGEVDQVSENVEVVEHYAFETADTVGVSGLVRNTSDQPLDSVEVEVTLNDGDTLVGEFIDTSEEEIDFLPPDEQWRFWVVFEDETFSDGSSYTINVDAEVADDAGGATETGEETGTEGTSTAAGGATEPGTPAS